MYIQEALETVHEERLRKHLEELEAELRRRSGGDRQEGILKAQSEDNLLRYRSREDLGDRYVTGTVLFKRPDNDLNEMGR